MTWPLPAGTIKSASTCYKDRCTSTSLANARTPTRFMQQTNPRGPNAIDGITYIAVVAAGSQFQVSWGHCEAQLQELKVPTIGVPCLCCCCLRSWYCFTESRQAWEFWCAQETHQDEVQSLQSPYLPTRRFSEQLCRSDITRPLNRSLGFSVG